MAKNTVPFHAHFNSDIWHFLFYYIIQKYIWIKTINKNKGENTLPPIFFKFVLTNFIKFMSISDKQTVSNLAKEYVY